MMIHTEKEMETIVDGYFLCLRKCGVQMAAAAASVASSREETQLEL